MATVADLLVRIEANTQQMRNALRTGETQLNRFEQRANKSTKGVADGFMRTQRAAMLLRTGLATLGVGAAALSFAGLVQGARNALTAFDALEDAAATMNFGVERLQELRYVAEQAGVDVLQLEDGLRRMTRRIGLFAQDGGGPAAKAFEQLGIDVRDTNGAVRSSEDIFDDVVRALGKYEDQATRAAIASQVFGDDAGPKLTLLLNQGADGIARLSKEARNLGVVIDQELVSKAADTNDKLAAMQRIIDTNLNAALVDLSPVIVGVTKEFALWAREISKVIDGFRGIDDMSMKGLERTVNELDTAFSTKMDELRIAEDNLQFLLDNPRIFGNTALARKEVEALRAEAKAIQQQLMDAQTELASRRITRNEPPSGGTGGSPSGSDKEAEKIQKVIDSLEFQRQQLVRLPREQAVYNAMQQAGITANHEMAESVRAAALAYYDASEAVEDLAEKSKAEDDARKNIAATIAELQQENRLLQVQGVEREKLRAILEAENVAREGGIELSDRERAQIEGLIEANTRLVEAEEAAAEAARDAREFARDFGNVIANSFEDAVLSGEKFSDVLKSLEQDIARIILRMAVTKPLESAIGGMFGSFDFGSIFGSMFGGVSASAGYGQYASSMAGTGLTNLSGGAFANGGIMTSKGEVPLRKYATGGVATSPQLALFGEGSTPEAYVPLPDGRNIPVKMEGGGSGGFTYSPVFNIDARNSTLSGSEIKQIIETAEQRSVAQVRKLQRQSGGRPIS